MRRDDYRQAGREVGRSAPARALNSVEFDPSTPAVHAQRAAASISVIRPFEPGRLRRQVILSSSK